MKCQECVNQGLKSRVYPNQYAEMTMQNNSPYYDEDGLLVDKSKNKIMRGYSCSNGHKWHQEDK